MVVNTEETGLPLLLLPKASPDVDPATWLCWCENGFPDDDDDDDRRFGAARAVRISIASIGRQARTYLCKHEQSSYFVNSRQDDLPGCKRVRSARK